MKLAGVSSIKTLPRSRSQKVFSISITAFEPVSFSVFFFLDDQTSESEVFSSCSSMLRTRYVAYGASVSALVRREIWNESKKLKRNEGERACFNDDKSIFYKTGNPFYLLFTL